MHVKLMSDSRPNAVATVIRAFCVLAFLSLAFCVLALLSFTAGTVPPQAGPVMDALPADRDYVASITASISGLRGDDRH